MRKLHSGPFSALGFYTWVRLESMHAYTGNVLSFCLSEACTHPVLTFITRKGTFILLCVDLSRSSTPGGSRFATQAGGIIPMQKHCCDTASFCIKQCAKLGDVTAVRVLEVHGKKEAPEQDNRHAIDKDER